MVRPMTGPVKRDDGREQRQGGAGAQGARRGPRKARSNARAVAAEVLADLLVDPGARASERLALALSEMRPASAAADSGRESQDGQVLQNLQRDRALTTELVYGVLRWRRELERLLSPHLSRAIDRLEPLARTFLLVGAYQIAALNRIPPEVAVSATQDAARTVGLDRITGLINAVLRKVVASAGGKVDLSLRGLQSLPPWIAAELEARYGASAADEANALRERARVTLRPNLARGGLEAARLMLADDGLEVEVRPAPLKDVATFAHPPSLGGGPERGMLAVAHGDPFASRAFHQGLFVAQDPASLAIADLIACFSEPGARVLDTCAGRGVKTTALLELGFEVSAVDVGPGKLSELERVARRLGVDAGLERVVALDASDPAALAPLGLFPVVLVDAPCSGLGTLRRHPEIAWRIEPRDVEGLVALQARLMASASASVAPGGLLVYAVCTFVGREGRPPLPSGFEVLTRLDVPPTSGLDAFQALVLRRSPT